MWFHPLVLLVLAGCKCQSCAWCCVAPLYPAWLAWLQGHTCHAECVCQKLILNDILSLCLSLTFSLLLYLSRALSLCLYDSQSGLYADLLVPPQALLVSKDSTQHIHDFKNTVTVTTRKIGWNVMSCTFKGSWYSHSHMYTIILHLSSPFMLKNNYNYIKKNLDQIFHFAKKLKK